MATCHTGGPPPSVGPSRRSVSLLTVVSVVQRLYPGLVSNSQWHSVLGTGLLAEVSDGERRFRWLMRLQDYEGSRQLAVFTTEHQKGFCNGRRRVGDYSPLRRWKEAVVGGNRRLRSHQQRQACDEALKSRNRRRSGYVCTPIPRWFAHGSSALTRTRGMVASQHIAIQGHRHKDIKKNSSRSIGTLAFAEVHSKGTRTSRPMEQAWKQQRGDNNKTTRADKRGKTGREQKNGTRRRDTPSPETPLLRHASTCVRSPVPAT